MNPTQIRMFLEKYFGKALSAKALQNLEQAGPVQEGMKRMFRGEGLPGQPVGRGQMFTSDLKEAAAHANFQKEPMVNMVDVPEIAAERGALPKKGIDSLTGGRPDVTARTSANRASFLVPKLAMQKKQIFPIIAALAVGKIGEDEALAQIEQIPTGYKEGSGWSGMKEQLADAGDLVSILTGTRYSGNIADMNLGLKGTTPVYGPEEDIFKIAETPVKKQLTGAAALAKGEGVLSKASAEAANLADAALPSEVSKLPRRAPEQSLPRNPRQVKPNLDEEARVSRMTSRTFEAEPRKGQERQPVKEKPPGVSQANQQFLDQARSSSQAEAANKADSRLPTGVETLPRREADRAIPKKGETSPRKYDDEEERLIRAKSRGGDQEKTFRDEPGDNSSQYPGVSRTNQQFLEQIRKENTPALELKELGKLEGGIPVSKFELKTPPKKMSRSEKRALDQKIERVRSSEKGERIGEIKPKIEGIDPQVIHLMRYLARYPKSSLGTGLTLYEIYKAATKKGWED